MFMLARCDLFCTIWFDFCIQFKWYPVIWNNISFGNNCKAYHIQKPYYLLMCPKHITLHCSQLILHPPFFTLHPSTFSLTVEVGVWQVKKPSCPYNFQSWKPVYIFQDTVILIGLNRSFSSTNRCSFARNFSASYVSCQI